MALTDFILHPLSLNVCQCLVIALINGYTAPDDRIRFYLGLPLAVTIAVYAAVTAYSYTGSATLASAMGSPPTGLLLQYLDTALIGRWSFHAGGPLRQLYRPEKPGPDTAGPRGGGSSTMADKRANSTQYRRRFIFGLQSIGDIRGTNTPWESKDVPRFSSADPSWAPSKRYFLVARVIESVVCYIVGQYILGGTPAVASLRGGTGQYASAKVHILGRLAEVTIDELRVRYITTIKQFVLVMCGLQLVFNLVAVPAVALGMSQVQDFRPLFGSPWEAYTVKRFWSPFYHQIWRRRFTSIAQVVTDDLLRLRKGTVPARYLSYLLAFLLSGLLHWVQDVAGAIPWYNSGAIIFFVAQVGAFAVEDLVGRLCGLRGKEPSLALRILGFMWVATFLAFFGPHWVYPALERDGW